MLRVTIDRPRFGTPFIHRKSIDFLVNDSSRISANEETETATLGHFQNPLSRTTFSDQMVKTAVKLNVFRFQFTSGAWWCFPENKGVEIHFPAVSQGNSQSTAIGLTREGKPEVCFRKKEVFP